MATLPTTYSKFIDSLASGLVDLGSDSFKAMLLSAYTVGTTDDDAQFVADVLAVATESSGTGYTAGGKLLTTVTWTQSGGTWTLDCDDVTWAAATVSADYALFYDSTPGSDATNPVIGFWDLGGTFTTTASDFTLPINASGLLTIGA